jgi:predicted secreted Zn-dependent protease
MPSGRRGQHSRALFLLFVLPLAVAGCAGLQPTAREWVTLRTSTSTQYYPVSGVTTRAIFDAINGNGVSDGKGRPAVGLTTAHWELGGVLWSGPSSCDNASVTIGLKVVVTLPQLGRADGRSSDVEARWQRFAARVAAHEQRHVDIYLDGAQVMKARMETAPGRPSSCAALQTAIQRIWTSQQAEIEENQEHFHLEDEARLQTDRLALQAQVDTDKARLSAIEAEIRTGDLSLEDLRRQVDVTRSQIDVLEAEMRRSASAPSSCSEPRPAPGIDTLCQEYESLGKAHRALVERHNRMIERRRALVEEHTRIRAITNDLIEALNWTR